jgi:hypothetical protein
MAEGIVGKPIFGTSFPNDLHPAPTVGLHHKSFFYLWLVQVVRPAVA